MTEFPSDDEPAGCACAVSGHATAAPPRSDINSRRHSITSSAVASNRYASKRSDDEELRMAAVIYRGASERSLQCSRAATRCSHSERQLVYQKRLNQDGTLGNETRHKACAAYKGSEQVEIGIRGEEHVHAAIGREPFASLSEQHRDIPIVWTSGPSAVGHVEGFAGERGRT